LNDRFSDTVFYFDFIESTLSFNSAWATQARISDIEMAFKSSLKRGGKESLNVYFVESLAPPPGENTASWSGKCGKSLENRRATTPWCHFLLLRNVAFGPVPHFRCPFSPHLPGFTFLPNSNASDGPKDGVVLAATNGSDERRPNTLVHEVVRTIITVKLNSYFSVFSRHPCHDPLLTTVYDLRVILWDCCTLLQVAAMQVQGEI